MGIIVGRRNRLLKLSSTIPQLEPTGCSPFGGRLCVSSNDRLRNLVEELEKSIEHAIASSPRVESCLARVGDEGYELSLVLQATLAFAPKSEPDAQPVEALTSNPSNQGEPTMSPTDKQFLRSLKISIEEEHKP